MGREEGTAATVASYRHDSHTYFVEDSRPDVSPASPGGVRGSSVGFRVELPFFPRRSRRFRGLARPVPQPRRAPPSRRIWSRTRRRTRARHRPIPPLPTTSLMTPAAALPSSSGHGHPRRMQRCPKLWRRLARKTGARLPVRLRDVQLASAANVSRIISRRASRRVRGAPKRMQQFYRSSAIHMLCACRPQAPFAP